MPALGANAESSTKLNFVAPQEQVTRVRELAKEFGYSLSEVLRVALSRIIQELEAEARDREIARSCKANFVADRTFAAEWANYETRID